MKDTVQSTRWGRFMSLSWIIRHWRTFRYQHSWPTPSSSIFIHQSFPELLQTRVSFSDAIDNSKRKSLWMSRGMMVSRELLQLDMLRRYKDLYASTPTTVSQKQPAKKRWIHNNGPTRFQQEWVKWKSCSSLKEDVDQKHSALIISHWAVFFDKKPLLVNI